MSIPKGGIGFFDSGIGGLTVLSACQNVCKDEFIYYYGDQARAPYGNKSYGQIYRYTLSAMRKFRRLKAKAVVIACNTVTAVCVERLRKKFSFPIIGAEPAVYPAAKRGGEVFVLTTRATHESARFQNLCRDVARRCPQSVVRPFSCDGLAGAIERNIGKEFDYAEYLPRGKPAAVVLGCTHYIYIKEEIKRLYGCEVYDGNEGIAKRLSDVLSKPEKFKRKKQKNRDSQPRFSTRNKNINKLNKRSRNLSKKTMKNVNNQTLFFLGKSRESVRFVYKQTFVCLNVDENGLFVVKKIKKKLKNLEIFLKNS